MSHYEERLQDDLDKVRSRVVEAMRYAHTAVDNAVNALVHNDHQLAHDTALGDLALNRHIRDLDRMCHAFIARHLPSAGHLRMISSVLRINIAIERIGDYAVTIARESVQLSGPPSEEIRRDARAMTQQALQMLEQATQAVDEANPELARGTIAMARQIDSTWDTAFHDLLEAGAIADPFVAEQEKDCQWVGETAWRYRCEFEIDPLALECDHLELALDGVDTVRVPL